jgi:Reverse transcriptase (RNA-dependent DNA polymerase)
VKNTFLQGTLDEEIYITLPTGYAKEGNANTVCKLNKSFYGLKQSPRVWYKKLSSYLNSYNFNVSSVDHSLFSKINDNYTIIVLIYVDDIIITCNNLEEIKRVKEK